MIDASCMAQYALANNAFTDPHLQQLDTNKQRKLNPLFIQICRLWVFSEINLKTDL